MDFYKKTIFFFIFIIAVPSCVSSKQASKKEQPVVIANAELEYEITIIDPGFTSYLYSIAKPMSYYSQSYLESKNWTYVTTWNQRVSNPLKYDSSIYENNIDYQSNVDYGLEVNYKLFSYFKFAEQKYRMSLNR